MCLLHVLKHLHLLLLLLQGFCPRPDLVLEPLLLLSLVVMRLLLGLDLGLKELHVLHAAPLLLQPASLDVLLGLLPLYILDALLPLELGLPSPGLRDGEVLKMLLEDAVLPLRCVSDLVLEPDVVVSEHVSAHADEVLLTGCFGKVGRHRVSRSLEWLSRHASVVWAVLFLQGCGLTLHLL